MVILMNDDIRRNATKMELPLEILY